MLVHLALFNHHVEPRRLSWRGISRGLAIERVTEINKLSPFTLAAMVQCGIKRQHLMWDDVHNGPNEVGIKVTSIGSNKLHHPWRATAWEVHPILKIEPID